MISFFQFSFAQNLNSSKTGDLFVQAFQGNTPVMGLKIIVQDQVYETNSTGSILLNLEAGSYLVHVPQGEQILPIEIQEDLETLVKINVNPLLKASAEVEAAPIFKPLMTAESTSTLQFKAPETTENTIEEFVVLAPQSKVSIAALIEVRKKSSGVTEVLGSEQMSRQGDSDAASSLRRVTGLTLMGGKYVFVRGLGDRYSSIQLNGFKLPSPEPSRRVVPLDLFPTSILDSVIVQKNYLSSFSADFGGGLIQLQTRNLPDKLYAQINLGQSFNDVDDYASYAGGSQDWTGHDDGTRQMPAAIRSALATGKKLIESQDPQLGFTKEELRALGASLRKNYSIVEKSSEPLPSMQIGLGNTWKFEGFNLGASSSVSYSSVIDVDEEKTAQFDVPRPGELSKSQDGRLISSEVDRKLSGTLNLGIDLKKDHRLSILLLALRHSSDETSVNETTGPGINDYARKRTRTEWVERDLFIQQLKGGSKISEPLQLDWRMGRSSATRNAPDSKEYDYRKITSSDPFLLDPEVSGNIRNYNNLIESNDEWGLELTHEIQKFKTQVGVSEMVRDRSSDTFRLQYVKDYLAGEAPDLSRSPDEIFSDAEDWVLVNQTGTADSYSGFQRTQSLFWNTQWQPNPKYEFILGHRLENSVQKVQTFYYYNKDDIQSLGLNESRNLLPSYAMTWKPNDVFRLRFAYGESIARPDFRELSTVRYIDDDTGYEAKGNTELKQTIIRHFDHRIEYYFQTDEYISLGLFYKRFQDPIEDVFQPSAGSLIKVPQNAISAENRGLEVESRLSFRHLNRDLRRWSLMANYSIIDSEVKLDEAKSFNLTSRDRALQGQSPYVLNMSLFYDRPAEGIKASLLYNILGRRITEVGTDLRPDIFEQPSGQLDFVFSQKIKNNMQLGFKARNLLDPSLQAKQGDEIVRTRKKGRAYSLGLTWAI